MRVLLPVLAVLVVLAACSDDTPKTSQSIQSTTAPTAAIEKVIAVPPCELPVPANEMIPGTFEVRGGTQDTTIATAQCSRSWDRAPAEAATGGATRVAINGRLYRNIVEGKEDFDLNFSGEIGRQFVSRVIEARGFLKHQVTVTEAPNPPALGVDQQVIYRAEYTRGNAIETWVDYYIFMRVKNTFASIQVSAQHIGGAEAKGLVADMQTVAKKQADRLLAFPATADPIYPTPLPAGARIIPLVPATPTATP